MSRGGMKSIDRPSAANLAVVDSASGAAAGSGRVANGDGKLARERCGFQMPLHYPRYTQAEYEAMPEWKLDCLLTEYGLHVNGDVMHKRKFAMGAFLWTY